MRIQEIMTTDVETIEPDALVSVATERMRVGGIHHLVVVQGKSIVGVLSSGDVVILPSPNGRPGGSVR
jgi:CBS domain-containing protein